MVGSITKWSSQHRPTGTDIAWRLAIWGPVSIAATFGMISIVRRQKTRRHTERPVGWIELPPTVCPKCGAKSTAAVEWGGAAPIINNFRAKLGIAVILGGQKRPENGPDWVCLNCQPAWSEINRLSQEGEQCQRTMEELIAGSDFVSAAEWRDKKCAVQKKLAEALRPLLNE